MIGRQDFIITSGDELSIDHNSRPMSSLLLMLTKMLTTEVVESLAALQNICRNVDLPGLRFFFSVTFPSMAQEKRLHYCAHVAPTESCRDIFCVHKAEHLAEDAAGASSVAVFDHICDTFLHSSEPPLTWTMLKIGAQKGSAALAKSFWKREKGSFKILQPAHPHGSPGGTLQITIALQNDHKVQTSTAVLKTKAF